MNHSKKHHETSIISIENVSHSYKIIRCTRPKEFQYEAGQFLEIELYDETLAVCFRCHYSIASAPHETDHLEFCIQVVGDGKAIQFWKKAEVSQLLKISEPQGHFKIKSNTDPIVFIAGGSGIAPVFSILKQLMLKHKYTQPKTLYYGSKSALIIPYKNEILTFAKTNSHFEAFFVAEEEQSEFVTTGNVLSCLNKETHVFKENTQFLICGSLGMVKKVEHYLLSQGVSSTQIIKDG